MFTCCTWLRQPQRKSSKNPSFFFLFTTGPVRFFNRGVDKIPCCTTDNSLYLWWTPPQLSNRNGIITHYLLLYKQVMFGSAAVSENESQIIVNASENTWTQDSLVTVPLLNLKPNSRYDVHVQACVGSMCSQRSPGNHFFTKEGSKYQYSVSVFACM